MLHRAALQAGYIPEERSGYAISFFFGNGGWQTFDEGLIAAKKLEKYRQLSCEKCARLTWPDHRDHVSSFQSRNGKTRWGGGIKTAGGYCAISGLPELWDEAITVGACWLAGTLGYRNALQIFEISGNPHAEWLSLTIDAISAS